MSKATDFRKATVERALEGPGKSSNAQRRAAFDNVGVAEPSRALIAKVTQNAWKVTDADFAAAKASVPEDELFELTVCAALGQATRQIDAALAALDVALQEKAG